MKANELMTNDWVLYGGKPTRVFQLEEGKDYKNITPIPWTAKIAAKNGFKFEGGEYWLRCGALTIRTGDGYVAIVETYPSSVYHTRIHLIGVCFHELQHALRLAGLSDVADKLKI